MLSMWARNFDGPKMITLKAFMKEELTLTIEIIINHGILKLSIINDKKYLCKIKAHQL